MWRIKNRWLRLNRKQLIISACVRKLTKQTNDISKPKTEIIVYIFRTLNAISRKMSKKEKELAS